jgi:hypothetical protein
VTGSKRSGVAYKGPFATQTATMDQTPLGVGAGGRFLDSKKGTQTTSIGARRSQLRTHAAAVLVGLVDGSDSGDWPGGSILRVVHTTIRPPAILPNIYKGPDDPARGQGLQWVRRECSTPSLRTNTLPSFVTTPVEAHAFFMLDVAVTTRGCLHRRSLSRASVIKSAGAHSKKYWRTR